jgi:hypothetical protein
VTSFTFDPSRFDNPVRLGLYLLSNLRELGVPVVGVLWPIGVESGELTIGSVDLVDGTVEYRWSEGR